MALPPAGSVFFVCVACQQQQRIFICSNSVQFCRVGFVSLFSECRTIFATVLTTSSWESIILHSASSSSQSDNRTDNQSASWPVVSSVIPVAILPSLFDHPTYQLTNSLNRLIVRSIDQQCLSPRSPGCHHGQAVAVAPNLLPVAAAAAATTTNRSKQL